MRLDGGMPLLRRVEPTVLVAFFATAVSLVAIGQPSLWGDEVATLMSAQRSLPELWAMLGNVDAVHGAYYLFMHAWVDLFGGSAMALRLPSALAVGVAAAGVVELVRRFESTAVAVTAGVVFGLLPKVQELGGEARSYAVTMAFAAWLGVLVVVAARRNTAWWWAAYALLLSVASVWFVYLLLLAAAQLVWVWVEFRAARRGVVAAGVAALMAVSPFVAVAFAQRGQVEWILTAGLNSPEQVLVTAWFGAWPLALAVWALMVLVVVAAFRQRNRSQLRWLGIASSTGPLAVLWILSAVFPVFTPRYLAMGTPFVAVTVSLALVLLWRWRRWVAALVAAVLLLLAVPTWVEQRGPFAKRGSDWAQVSQLVGAEARPGDVVVFDESGEPWFRPRLAMRAYPSGFAGLVDPVGLGLTTADVWDTNVRPLALADIAGVERVWLVERAGRNAAEQRAVLTEAGFTATESWKLNVTEVTEFTRAV